MDGERRLGVGAPSGARTRTTPTADTAPGRRRLETQSLRWPAAIARLVSMRTGATTDVSAARTLAQVVVAVVASLILVAHGFVLIVFGMFVGPAYDAPISTSTSVVSVVVGSAVVATCLPVVYLAARDRLAASLAVLTVALAGQALVWLAVG